MEQVEISIKDLSYRIFRGWRSILVCMIVFALLLDVVTVMKNKKYVHDDKQENVSEENLSIEEARKDLLDADIYLVDSALVAYQTYIQYLDYLNNSPIMAMDATKVPTLSMSYYINTHYVAEYPVIQYKDPSNAIIEAYIWELSSQTTYELLADGFISQIDATYLPRLFFVTNNSTGAMLQIKLFAPTLEDCEKQADVIDSIIKKKTSKIKELYGDFDITQIASVCTEDFDSAVLEEKRTATVNLYNYRSYYINMESSLTDEQRVYYEACLREMGYEVKADDKNAEAVVEDEEGGQTALSAETRYIYPKRVIIGAFLGAFLACGFIFVAYIMSSTLRSKDDMESGFHFAVIGTVASGMVSKKWLRAIDGWIYKLFYGRGPKFTEEEHINMICAGIRISVEKEGYQNVYLTGTGNDEETLRIQKLMSERLKKEKIDVADGISVIYDPESLEKMTSSSAVVFVERVGMSLYKDIEKEKKLAERYKIPVIGTVVIEG